MARGATNVARLATFPGTAESRTIITGRTTILAIITTTGSKIIGLRIITNI